ncbi:MAG: PorT family protein [Chitinophagaceae bacterium]|nr:PorT family protein [Chitinophagaceae bacterium]
MRNRQNTDEFEDYLQRQAEHHRMYPSGFLWNNIRESLHGKPKWPALTYIALSIIVTLIVTTILLDPNKNPLQTSSRNISKNVSPKGSLEEHISAAYLTRSTINKVNYSQAVAAVNAVNIQPQQFLQETIVARPSSKNTFQDNSLSFVAASALKPNLIFMQGTEAVVHKDEAAAINDLTLAVKEVQNESGNGGLKQITEEEKMTYFPVVVLTNRKKTSRWEWQAHITPSASYRRLVDENHSTPKTYVTAVPVSANYSIDVNDVVRHKPGIGMEAGLSAGFHLTEQLIINAGLQYNAHGYDIEAFAYKTEPTAVTLTGATTQTLMSFSQYRLTALGYPILLKNRYHEISIPVGVEWRGNFNKRFAWGIGASVQPTYVFNKTPFIVTTNYKSYTEGTNLLQNFNINTSIETYLSYKTGNLRWQIGPQFRYQQSPTFSNKYPIREYLMDYGVKLGVTKSFR